MLFDTHCHLDAKQFKNNINEIINNAKKNNVKKILIPAIKPGLPKIKIKNIYLATGSHPYHSDETIKNEQKIIDGLKDAVAIGETGLDFFKCPIEKKIQIESLEFQCELAVKANMPIILHERNSFSELIEIIKKYPEITGVFHAFNPSEKELKTITDLNFYVGLGGMITYKKNDALREAVKKGPMEKFILETDSPYLAPQTKRGQVNQPANLLDIAKHIAFIKNKTLNEISLLTTENANRLFKL